ncbi:60S ribosomal protein L31 [Candidatus Woesearchaeota archaeon]|nr:60S ribosomal protein L31 [Candidatus Woesearchaeota archaeon]
MAKKETTIIERTYTVPLRREFLKAPQYRRAKKAVTALKQFLEKHMKSKNVKLGNEVNLELWKHGIKNPPHHVKVTATKNEKGEVTVELFGLKKEALQKETKKERQKEKKTEKAEEAKKEEKTDKKAEKTELKPSE